MAKVIFALLLLASAALAWRFLPSLRARMPDDFQKLSGPERVARARVQSEAAIREKFRAAGVPYPGKIFLRWFKREAELEVWARGGADDFRLVARYPILKSSGGPGPKRREGDKQVPEGIYVIDRFNPQSLYHLSLGLNYPNAADRVLSDAKKPGGDIFIHGKDVTIGCAPLGDPGIEEVYLAALDARDAGQAQIAVHIFPARMQGAAWTEFAAAATARRPELADFWAQLQPIYAAFEQRRVVPEATITREGRYQLNPR